MDTVNYNVLVCLGFYRISFMSMPILNNNVFFIIFIQQNMFQFNSISILFLKPNSKTKFLNTVNQAKTKHIYNSQDNLSVKLSHTFFGSKFYDQKYLLTTWGSIPLFPSYVTLCQVP